MVVKFPEGAGVWGVVPALSPLPFFENIAEAMKKMFRSSSHLLWHGFGMVRK